MWKVPVAFGSKISLTRTERGGRAAPRFLPTRLLALTCVMLWTSFSPLEAWPAGNEMTDRTNDNKTVEQCLALTAANKAALAHTRGVEIGEPATPEARLRAAAQDARQSPESCIGVISGSCAGPESAISDTGQVACLNRELDVWDARLNDAYRRVINQADPDVKLRFIKVQRAWLMWRDASCAQPNVVFQGTMAGPMQAQCLRDATARQALWLESWADH